MSYSPPAHNYGRRIYKRILRIILWILGIFFILIIIIILLVQTPYVQNIARTKAEQYLSRKLRTRVEIKALSVSFPSHVSLGGIYIEDRQKDTLLAGKKLELGLNMWKLLHNEFAIGKVELSGFTCKIKRELPDTSFNFQFIIDAFAPTGPQKPKPASDTAQMVITLQSLQLDSIRVIYKDVVTGNDLEAWIGHTAVSMKEFNTVAQRFAIASLQVKDTRGRFYRVKPLLPPHAINPSPGKAPYFALQTFLLDNVLLDYRDSAGAFYTSVALGKMAGEIQSMDVDQKLIQVKSITLDQTSASVLLGKKAPVPVVKKTGLTAPDSSAGWRIMAARLELNNDNIQYDDDNQRRTAPGMDYAHIKTTGLTLHAANLLYSPDTITAHITQGSMKEKSGFELSRLQTRFLYSSRQAYLEDLDLRTPHTILRDFVRIHYPSLGAFKNNPRQVKLDLQLRDSRVLLKDVLYFAPQLAKQELFRHPGDILKVNSRVTGTMGDMNVEQLQLSGIGSTVIDIAGIIHNPTDAKHFSANLRVKNIAITRKDLLAMLPPGTLPSNISLPETARMSGTLTGGTKEMNANLVLNTSSGNIVLKGFLRPLDDIKHAAYDLHLETKGLDIGYILQDPKTFGTLSGVFNAKGKGMDMHNTHAVVDGNISEVFLKGYTYHNLVFNAKADGDAMSGTALARDTNLRFNLDFNANTANKYPAVKAVLTIDTVNAWALHLVDSAMGYHGIITADFVNTDPDALDGHLVVSGSQLQNGRQHIVLDTLQLLAGMNDSGRFIRVTADPLALQLYGQYKLTQMGDVFRQTMEPYFSLKPDSVKKAVDPYNFFVKATLTERPMLKTLVPDLKKLSPVSFDGHFSNSDTLRLALDAPLIIVGTNTINELHLRGNGNTNRLQLQLSLARAKAAGLSMYQTDLSGSLAHNKADFALNNKDIKGKDRYHLDGALEYLNQQYAFALKPGNLLLNYDKWNINQDNKIVFGKGDVDVNRFELSRNAEKLTINTGGSGANDSLQVGFENFKIATLTSFVQSDSTRFNGNLQGSITIHNLETKPTFTSDLLVKDFEALRDTVGNIQVKINNTTPDVYAADLTLTGHGNDAQVSGSYDTHPNVASPIHMKADIRKLQLASLQGVSGGAITEASGYLQGNMAISGSMDKPLAKGDLEFKSVKFNLAMLNSFFAIDSERVAFDETGFNFDTFTIVDSSGNEAVIDGNVFTTDYRNYKFDADLTANNFHALNSTKKNNKNYYGQLYFTSQLSIKGTPTKPIIDGRIVINDKTNLTLAIPQSEPGVEERKGIVEFVSHVTQEADSTATLAADSVLAASLAGMDISVNVEMKKEAQLNIIIDPDTGDMLSVQGEALLNGGVDPGGNITLTGSYEIEKGTYELTFNLLHRKFNIQKGSKLIWKGAPREAEADITAIYAIETPPIDLVLDQMGDMSETQKNSYRQRLPFQVQLNMKGELLKPDITFDILLPENQNYSVGGDVITRVNNKLDQLRKEPSELNKQVFALLLLGRFVSENPFQSSVAGMTPESFARKSAGALLADQLNQLAGSLVKGVDINFGVVSEDDYSTGERVNKTDLNVALSKKLFNDRITVTVGNNFELEGPQQAGNQASAIAGSIAVDYRLSKDGRYLLRAYRKNGYQGVLEGYVVETGVGFIITLDYNHFKEIFQKRKVQQPKPAVKKKKKP